jgi:hypothetical protein
MYCNLNNKEPSVELLAKIIRFSRLVKEIRTIRTSKVEYSPKTKEVQISYSKFIIN